MNMVKALVLILFPVVVAVSIHARERAISLGVADHQHVNITITKTTDPANHGCCVTLPPSLIEIYLVDGELALDAAIAENPPAWFDFGTMAIDDNFEFTGQSTATVAGFSNVQSSVTGTIEDGFMRGKFRVGLGGRLPTGNEISFDFTMTPAASGPEFYFSRPIGSIFGNPLFNGVGVYIEPRGIAEDQPIDLAVAMDTGGETFDADWWLVLVHGDEFFSFDVATLEFKPGLQPSLQGPLTDVLDPVQVLNQFTPPFSDEFTIVWGIDRNPNGTVDLDSFSGNGFEYYFY